MLKMPFIDKNEPFIKKSTTIIDFILKKKYYRLHLRHKIYTAYRRKVTIVKEKFRVI